MSKITITVKTKNMAITEIFDEKKWGSSKAVLKATLDWLVLGTEFEGVIEKKLIEELENALEKYWIGSEINREIKTAHIERILERHKKRLGD